MNIELLEWLKTEVLARPEGFDMDWWHQKRDRRGRLVELAGDTPCGTVHCLAGLVQMKTGESGYAGGVARRALELTGAQGERLFHRLTWPQDLREAYRYALANKDQAECARVAAERIDRFIASGGEE